MHPNECTPNLIWSYPLRGGTKSVTSFVENLFNDSRHIMGQLILPEFITRFSPSFGSHIRQTPESAANSFSADP